MGPAGSTMSCGANKTTVTTATKSSNATAVIMSLLLAMLPRSGSLLVCKPQDGDSERQVHPLNQWRFKSKESPQQSVYRPRFGHSEVGLEVRRAGSIWAQRADGSDWWEQKCVEVR